MKITNSKIEYLAHALNFANFCDHGCKYCYMQTLYQRFYKHRELKVDILVGELRKQLDTFQPRGDIMMSTSHDPFQPATYDIAFAILETLKEYPSTYKYIRILTKARIHEKDLKRVPHGLKSFGMTVTTLRRNIQKILEPNASPPSKRILQLLYMKEHGYPIWISAEPMLQGMDLYTLADLVDPDEIWVGTLNYVGREIAQYAMPIPEILRQIKDLREIGINVKLKKELITKARRRGLM